MPLTFDPSVPESSVVLEWLYRSGEEYCTFPNLVSAKRGPHRVIVILANGETLSSAKSLREYNTIRISAAKKRLVVSSSGAE